MHEIEQGNKLDVSGNQQGRNRESESRHHQSLPSPRNTAYNPRSAA